MEGLLGLLTFCCFYCCCSLHINTCYALLLLLTVSMYTTLSTTEHTRINCQLPAHKGSHLYNSLHVQSRKLILALEVVTPTTLKSKLIPGSYLAPLLTYGFQSPPCEITNYCYLVPNSSTIFKIPMFNYQHYHDVHILSWSIIHCIANNLYYNDTIFPT